MIWPGLEKYVILFLQNNHKDFLETERAFVRSGITAPIHMVRYTDECLSYLRGIGVYSDRKKYPVPLLCVIDLDKLEDEGLKLIARIRSNKEWDKFNIVVLLAKSQSFLVEAALSLGANAFVYKNGPGDLVKMVASIDLLEEFINYQLNI